MGRWLPKIALSSISFFSALFLSSSIDSADLSDIDALAPFEVVAEGFREPMGVVVDESGAIFVSDRKAGKVLKITEGTKQPIITGLRRPVGLAFDTNGRLLIVEEKTGFLLRLETDGRLTILAEGVRKPRWMAVARDGTVYISAQGIKQKKDRDRDKNRAGDDEKVHGEVILRLTLAGELTGWASGFKGLEGLIVHEGAVFVAAKELKKARREGGEGKRKGHGGVYRIPVLDDGSAGPISRVSQDGIEKPVGLARDSLGAFYVSEKRIEIEGKIKDSISKVWPDGTVSRFARRVKKPRSLALDSFGNLYVAHGKGKEKGGLVRFRAPLPLTLAVPLLTNQSPLTLAGTTEPNSRIDAFLNDSNPPATFLVDDGNFSLTLHLALNTQNSLAVFTTAQSGEGLTSLPAEFTIIHDNISPLISNLTSSDGFLLNNQTPQIRADFSDNLSGIDVNSVAILLDGFNVASQAQVTATGFTLGLAASLIEGSHTATVNVSDLAGNTASLSSTFTIDATSPIISNLSPSGGSVISTATPLISAEFNDSLSGIDAPSVEIFLNGADVTSQATISATGFTLVPSDLSQDSHTVSVSVSDLAGNSASVTSTFTVSLGPGLDSIGDQVVEVGSTLIFTVSTTDPSGETISLSVTPLPLPTNATFNAASGLFTFKPDLGQVGSFDLTFTGTSGGQTDSETITITVQGPAPGTITALTGQILDSNDFAQGITTPVAGATVSLLGTGVSTTSNSNGDFNLTGIPASPHVLDIDSSTAGLAPDGSSYAGFREEIEIISGVNNDIDRPLFLPRIAAVSLTTVNPNLFTTVTNHDLGISLKVPPNTAKDENGNNFTGELSISLVPRDLAPAELPDFLDPGLLVTIQPVGVTFSTPVPITFPNIDNLPPGTEVDIWSLDAETGTFVIVGTGLVSPDGTRIETISGGIRAADWHFFLPLLTRIADAILGGLSSILDSFRATDCKCTSSVQVKDGSLKVDFSLPSYRSLGVSRSLGFVYKTRWANPKTVIPFEATIPVRAAVPPTLSYKLTVGGVDQGKETFVDSSGLSENIDETIRSAASFEASNLTSGLYPYTIRLTSNYLSSRVSSDIKGQVLVRNETQSPLGVGWSLAGVERLFTNFDGSLSVVSGNGSLTLFTPEETSPPFVNFSPPAGDFSTLVKNSDGTFTRTLKDGTQINYDSQGLETSMADRNGNSTSYSYDAEGRITSITDPAGLVMTFTYIGELLASITDPSGRQTTFIHDAQGNLTQVSFPDGSSKSFGYDNRHLMISETDERGFASQRQFDSLGRFVSGTRRDGTTAGATNVQSVGFVDLSSGIGSETNPAPVVRPGDGLSTLTDGKRNTTIFETDSFGATIRQVDALGQETLIERNENGSPTKITRPNGAVLTMAYDSLGNLLTSTDPLDATTIFTYEPNFNQVTSITDPKNNSTSINYDADGNPVEIIDALGNKTQMTYDSRGLLTSVTSAVGTPEENTTTFTYDANGNLLTTTDPLLNTTTLEYDNAGNVIKSTDAEGRVTEFTYDSMNRLFSVLDPDLKTTNYRYDPKGNLTQVTDAKNQTTTFAYDEMDRLTSATNPLGLTETFTYDANGNLTSTTNRNGQALTFDYDALNRLVKKTLPPSASQLGSQITTFDYNSVGNLTRVTNPATNVFNQYDLVNRLISSISSVEAAAGVPVITIDQDTLIDEDNLDFEGKTLRVVGKTLTIEGSHTFANLIFLNGAVLTHSPKTASEVGKLDITVPGTLQIDATSKIDVTSRGFLGGNQPGNPFASGEGMTVGFQQGSMGGSGGSYGSLGGSSFGSSNTVYGDFRDPGDVGSGGGGSRSGNLGGNGGGLIRIVAQTIVADGEIRIDGGMGVSGNSAKGGGSGGGIRIDVGTLTGTGQITANGGNGSNIGGGGGGGGRVAIYYQDATGFDFTRVTASGGAGSGNGPNGGAGTIYLQGPGREAGELVVDNNGVVAPSETTPIFTIPSGLLNLTDLRIRQGAKAKVESQLSVLNGIEISTDSGLSASDRVLASTIQVATRSSFDSAVDVIAVSVEVTDGSALGQLPTTGSLLRKLALNAETLTIDATSKIDVTARGFLGGAQTGNPFGFEGMTVGFQRGSTSGNGGSYGGLGGSFFLVGSLPNPVYGDFRDPNDLGSGGASSRSGQRGGNGGGLIRIVAQTIVMDGKIRSDGGIGDGGNSSKGGGSGGGIRLDVGTLSGTGTISANGGAGVDDGGGGGGGGRVAIFYQSAVGFDFSKVSASGGVGIGVVPPGGAGSVFLQGPGREAGELVLDNNGLVAADETTPIFTVPSSALLNFTELKIRGGAKAKVESQLSVINNIDILTDSRLSASDRVLASKIQVATRSSFDSAVDVIAVSLEVTGESALGQLPTTGSVLRKLALNVDSLTIDVTSKIDVTARGFLGGAQTGNPFGFEGMTVGFQRGSTSGNGGSYGGLGGSFFLVGSLPNPVYGDFRDPNDLGSGGASSRSGQRGGNGGGLIRIVAQTIVMDGKIRSDGGIGDGGNSSKGGGSGGGIRLDVRTLSGTGTISANGGAGVDDGGGGGGGRVAVYYESLMGFDLNNQVTAFGGSGIVNGQDGTIHLQQQTFTSWLLPDIDMPVMLALSPARPELNRTVEWPVLSSVEGKAEVRESQAVQLASLGAVPVGFYAVAASSRRDYQLTNNDSRIRFPDFKELIAKPVLSSELRRTIEGMLAQTGEIERPQRRVFSFDSVLSPQPTSLSSSDSVKHTNRYLLLASGSQLSALSDKQDDFDPIYGYDLTGNRISMIDPTGITTYTYDALNRLTSITNPSGESTTFTYDALGRRTSMTHDNGVVTIYTYDAASQLLSLVHQLDATTINSFNYTYDKVGNRKTKADNNGVADYTYDALNRLVEAVNPIPSNPLESFTYDGVGNRTASNQNGPSTFNDSNQLTEDDNFNYIYDENGNQVQKTNKSTLMSTAFEYDAENKLIRVASLDKTVNYKYDGLGRRIEKEVTETGVTTTARYIYDNEDILLELDGDNNIVARYTHGPGIDEPLITERSGQSFFYHVDALGTVTELTDSVGSVTQSYTYSSFGKIESQLDTNFFQPYTYTSREFDPETRLYHYRKRAYDPSIGRFLQEDPIGLGAEDVNFYGYVGNNPIVLVDPTGLINFLLGAGGSAVAPTGIEGSGGLVINPGFGIAQADIGVFSSLGAGVGVNVSGDVFAGFIKGGIENVSGLTVNQNFVLGPVSLSLFIDPKTGELMGGTLGVGPGAPPVGASTTFSSTGTLTLRDLIKFIKDQFIKGTLEPGLCN